MAGRRRRWLRARHGTRSASGSGADDRAGTRIAQSPLTERRSRLRSAGPTIGIETEAPQQKVTEILPAWRGTPRVLRACDSCAQERAAPSSAALSHPGTFSPGLSPPRLPRRGPPGRPPQRPGCRDAERQRGSAGGHPGPSGRGGAGWHTSRRRRVPGDIGLPPLSRYAPGLGPVGNIPEFLRQNPPSHRVRDGYAAIVDACRQACDALMRPPEAIPATTARSCARVDPWGSRHQP